MSLMDSARTGGGEGGGAAQFGSSFVLFVLRSQGEVGAAGLPFLGGFHEDGGDEAQDGGLVGEESGDTGSAFDLEHEGFGGDGVDTKATGAMKLTGNCFWGGRPRPDRLRAVQGSGGRGYDKHITLKGTDTEAVILSANPTAAQQHVRRKASGRHYNASPVTANPMISSCTIPADLDLSKSRVFLEADGLTPEAAASATVNGQFAGGFIGKPMRLDVTRLLKPGDNTIRLDPFSPKSARLVVY